MADKPILPTADVILGVALDKMYVERPTTFPYLDKRKGAYWRPFLGYRAQAAQSLKRCMDLAINNRLDAGSTGQDLQDYVASEYSAIPTTDPTFAIGSVVLTRASATKAGDIPAGTTIARTATPTDPVPLDAASYATTVSYHFTTSQLTSDPIPIVAQAAGAGPNHPIILNPPALVASPGGSLFDTFTVLSLSAAGGTESADDDYVKDFAKAFSVGQYGPTSAESKYGALDSTGVRHLLVFDLVSDAEEVLLVADPSWASSDRWAASVQQSIYDNDQIGFGCRVSVGTVTNKVVVAFPTVVLRDRNYLTDTQDVDTAIGKAIRSYFDDRDDWNIWTINGLQAAITRAHPKILYCSGVTLTDNSGTSVPEVATADYTQTQYHFYLANNASKITYQGPS